MAARKRIGAVIALFVLAGLYGAARPFLPSSPYIAIVEFPAALVAALIAWRIGRSRARVKPRAQLPPGRKHHQIIRDLPDPEAQRVRAALSRWIERGEAPASLARVLARSMARQGEAADEAARRIENILVSETRKGHREAAVRALLSSSSKFGENP